MPALSVVEGFSVAKITEPLLLYYSVGFGLPYLSQLTGKAGSDRKPPAAEVVLCWIPAFAGMTIGRGYDRGVPG